MEIIQLTDANLAATVKKAAQALRSGQLIVYPTDTVYGLGVDANNPIAIKRLRELKKREAKKPITVIVPSIDSISTYVTVPEHAKPLIQKFFPGPLTIIMPATRAISSEITLNGGIGIRYPRDAFSEALAREFGKPFTSTSANRSGRENPRTVQEILEQFKHDAHDIGLVIDGGEKVNGIPTTVVSYMHEPPVILRHGALTKEDLGI